MTTRVNFTIHERLPYCDCDLCKCNHGFNLDIAKKSEVVGKPATVYMSLKKWEFPFLRISQVIVLFCCRATPGASQISPWEWKGYRQTPKDKQTYRQTPKDKHTDWKTSTDKQTDRQSYASNGGGGSGSTQAANSGSLLGTLATFITPVL